MDVVQEYVTLKKAGLYFKGRCPFHYERTGSFTISPHRDIYYCFGCHKGGDLIAFICEAEHCSPLEAARHISERFEIDIPKEFQASKQEVKSDELKRYTTACDLVAEWCHSRLMESHEALNYLEKRGLTQKVISSFSLGYFPESQIPELLAFCKKSGFMAQDLMTYKILGDGKFSIYSPFTERIIFPIRDHLGRIRGFGGRTFKVGDARPKYYNSPDTTFFNKGSILFGLDRAKKKIQQDQSVFLVEGYMDCIAMAQGEYLNTVATLGTACTQEHLKMLSRYGQKLYITYDSDPAGQAAMIKLAQSAWSVNMDLYVISLPMHEDPASYFQKNQSFDSLIAQAQDIFLFFIQKLGIGYQHKPLNERVVLVSEFIDIIAVLDDPLKQNFLLQKAAATFAIPFSVLENRLKNSKQGIALPLNTDVAATECTTLDQKIVVALINYRGTLDPDDVKLLMKNCGPQVCHLLEKLLLCNSENGECNFTSFMDTLSDEHKELCARIMVEGEEDRTIEFSDLLYMLWKKEWKIIISDVTLKLKQANAASDVKYIADITKEFVELKEKMRAKGIL